MHSEADNATGNFCPAMGGDSPICAAFLSEGMRCPTICKKKLI